MTKQFINSQTKINEFIASTVTQFRPEFCFGGISITVDLEGPRMYQGRRNISILQAIQIGNLHSTHYIFSATVLLMTHFIDEKRQQKAGKK